MTARPDARPAAVRVLLAQDAPRVGDVAANVARVVDLLATHRDADLAVFPELFLTGYAPDVARTLGDACSAAVDPIAAAAAAARTAVVVGGVEPVAGGACNVALCVDRDGTVRGRHRKTHLFGADERDAFRPGERMTVVSLAGIRLAPLICFEIEFPELARDAARAGAQLLTSIAANPDPYGPDHALSARARALDNRLAHAYVNRTGDEGPLAFAGGSAAIDAGGRELAVLGREAGPAVVRLELDGRARAGSDLDYVAQLREPWS